MWTKYKNNTVRVSPSDFRSGHRLVWLKLVEVRSHAGLHLIHEGLMNPMAKKSLETTRPNSRTCVRSYNPIFIYIRSTSEASWDSGNKNIAVCSSYSIVSFLYRQMNWWAGGWGGVCGWRQVRKTHTRLWSETNKSQYAINKTRKWKSMKIRTSTEAY